MDPFNFGPLISTLVYSVVGMVMMGISFKLVTLLVPFSVKKEIEDDQNIALAIIIGSLLLGLSIIIAASISS
jgi:uncharacterized membrane protein YjfL (UPF0719 family)